MANRNMWLSMTRLRDTIAIYGHAMPIFMGVARPVGGCIVNCDSPLFINEGGRSVPISRGSPPTPD